MTAGEVVNRLGAKGISAARACEDGRLKPLLYKAFSIEAGQLVIPLMQELEPVL